MTFRFPPRRMLAAACVAAVVISSLPSRAAPPPEPDSPKMKQELQVLRARLLARLAEAPPPEAMTKLNADVKKFLGLLKDDGSFSDLDYTIELPNDGWQAASHLDRMLALTRAYAIKGSPTYRDAQLKSKILKTFRYWLAKDYANKNWFWNQIGIPERIAKTMTVFYEELKPAEKKKALEILGRAKIGGSGTNLVWLCEIVAKRGIFEGDPAIVKEAYARIAGEIQLAKTQSDGPQPDGSFNFHGPLLYSFGYGSYYLNSNADLAALVAGTAFAFPMDKVMLVRDWTLDGCQWLTRGRANDFGADGREIARKGQDAKILIGLGENLLKVGVGRDDEIKAMIARTKMEPGAPPLSGNKQFWRADMMVHQRPGYYASARMYSARTKNTEWGNGEALKSDYIADGCNIVMRDGREYANNADAKASADIYPVWDWQRIPGTTVELLPNFGSAEGKPDGFSSSKGGIVAPTKQTFVGGASDGTYGVSGGKFSRDSLAVQKTWFFFDDEFVCLGAGLKCDSDNPVVTTLDQSFLRGQVETGLSPRSPTTPATSKGDAEWLRWLLHGKTGYVFLTPALAQEALGRQTGDWRSINQAYDAKPVEADVFKAWIEHGRRPQDAAYAYAVLPDTDASKIAAYTAAPQVKIVSNTPALQAVWHEGLRRGAAFVYEPGEFEIAPGLKITADQPCVLLLHASDTGMDITAANPENKPLKLKVTASTGDKSATSDFDLPGGDLAGSSVTQQITY